MEKAAAPIVAQARALRALCNDLAHGAAREAFLARVDAEIAALGAGLRIAVVALGGVPLPALLASLVTSPASAAGPLVRVVPAGHGSAVPGMAQLSDAAAHAGIAGALMLVDPLRVVASPPLFGHVVHNTDVVVLIGERVPDSPLESAIAALAQAIRCAVHLRAGDEGPTALPFRDLRHGGVAANGAWLAGLRDALPDEARALAMAEAACSRLAQCADLLNRHLQAELAAHKFRAAEVLRLRRGEDAPEPGGDLREQAERLKSTLQAWATSCQDDLARMGEHGVLPFDPRLLAGKLTIDDLAHREEKSAAVAKYPWLGARALQSFLSHAYVVMPDPAAVEQVRQRLASALGAQLAKDVDILNHRAQDLAARLRANAELYPQFAAALETLRMPVLAPTALQASVAGLSLEVEIEEKFTRIGFFKRLMEGRMVASMAFSFLTMTAGVFVLFGEPNIKRGLMKFSGVIVIMMVLYFAFSMLVKGEEEKQELEEVLERIRARINQEIARPLAKIQQAIQKAYGSFVESVADAVSGAVEAVAKAKAAERAALAEQRKGEDEQFKAFLARRQQAAVAGAQKLPALVVALERARAELQKPPPAVVAPLRPTMASGASVASSAGAPASAAAAARGTSAANGAPPTASSSAATTPVPAPMTASERMAQVRAQLAERMAAAQGAKPMSASERLALAKGQPAGRAAGGTAGAGERAASDAARPAAAPAAAATSAPAPPAAPSAPAPAGVPAAD